MNNTIIKILIITFSIIFAVRITTIFAADRLYSISFSFGKSNMSYKQGISLLNMAERLDSTNVELYKRKYDIMEAQRKASKNPYPSKKELEIIKKMINSSPLWPSYHVYYALTLKKMIKVPNMITDSLILTQIKKAYELKPYSEVYQDLYQKYLNRFKSKYGQNNLPEYISSSVI